MNIKHMEKMEFIASLIKEIAFEKHLPLGIIARNTKPTQISAALLATVAGVSLSEMKSPTDQTTAIIDAAAQQLGSIPLYLCELPNAQKEEVLQKVKAMVQQFGVKCIVIDDLQEIADSVESLSQELGVLVYAPNCH